ncbi:MAG: hypothetical protein WB799_06300 [Candidatus Sulfotelmatobacter sp.]
MRLCEALRPVASSLILCVSLLWLLSPLAAKTAGQALDPGYVPALGVADRFLQAWQAGDVESGTVLRSSHAKEAATTDVVERFFSNPAPSAYEIGRGRLLKRGRYEFPVVLVSGTSKNVRPRRRFSSIIVVNTGNNDWAVDKLP